MSEKGIMMGQILRRDSCVNPARGLGVLVWIEMPIFIESQHSAVWTECGVLRMKSVCRFKRSTRRRRDCMDRKTSHAFDHLPQTPRNGSPRTLL